MVIADIAHEWAPWKDSSVARVWEFKRRNLRAQTWPVEENYQLSSGEEKMLAEIRNKEWKELYSNQTCSGEIAGWSDKNLQAV